MRLDISEFFRDAHESYGVVYYLLDSLESLQLLHKTCHTTLVSKTTTYHKLLFDS